MLVNLSKKNNRFLFGFLFLAFGMLCLSFASVPLYDLFCRVTGYAGTVQRSALAPGSNGKIHDIQIRFDSNISENLNWKFEAPKNEILVQPGVQKIVYYTAKNLSNEVTTGTAVVNVSPPKAGSVFMKVDCFCFVEQILKPGEEVKMPVSFYIDPSISDDDNTKNIQEITLSYTFYNANKN
jgi:cytochrome c oxidase assembly protein subunit 11